MGDVHEISRRLRARCESIFGIVFYTSEAKGAFGMTEAQWYMAGRAAPLGAVGAEVANAVFGSFNPRLVHAGLDGVWDTISPADMAERKLTSAVGGLATIVAPGAELDRANELLGRGLDGAAVAGHPLFAGLRAFPRRDDPVARLWRMCDMVREHRSDAHVSAWRAAGLDAVEVNVLNELWRSWPPGSVAIELMDWKRADVDAAIERLVDRGLAADGAITPAGKELRDEIEVRTSAQQSSLVDAIGDDHDELIALLDPWARAAVDYRKA